jgi:tRNA dimethylallyltransferase
MPEKYLIVVGGPTASGKTEFSIALARWLKTHIISADSRQFYREMSIGTAKPDATQLSAVPHHFINHISIHDNYSVGDFERDALNKMAELYQQTDTLVMCGGSGLYIKAVCEGLDVFPVVPEAVREKVQQRFVQEGIDGLQSALDILDPDYMAVVDRNNPARLIRALEVCLAAERPYSSFRTQTFAERPFTPIYLQLNWPREQLYDRINHRVALMMAQGLVDEARSLYPYRHLKALQTVGYQELFDYFDGASTLQHATDLIAQHTRNYAKRQLTWLRREKGWTIFHPDDLALAKQYIETNINHTL